MQFRKTNRGQPLFALFMIPLILLTSAPAQGATRDARPSFSRLSNRIRSMTERLDESLFGRGRQQKSGSLSAQKAALKTGPMTDPTIATAQAQEITESLPTEPLPDTVPTIKVGGSGPFSAELGNGRKEVFVRERTPAVGYWKNRYFLVEGNKTLAVSRTPIRFVPVDSGTVLNVPEFTDMNWNGEVNLNAFRGVMEIVYSNKSHKLWAVNELNVEEYLSGIAEADHSSAEEHLKVMAIVSRSYVVHHLAGGGRHASEPFHMKNSRNGNGDDQVYRGYLAEVRQPRIAKAAADTAGTVVTYQGRPVITPYSTRPSGRTLSPAEAGWKVDWPWVVSVPDPDTAGMTKLGHGVGLSGVGSRKRAERGETAAQILGYYFRGTGLGQVDTEDQTVRVAIFGR